MQTASLVMGMQMATLAPADWRLWMMNHLPRIGRARRALSVVHMRLLAPTMPGTGNRCLKAWQEHPTSLILQVFVNTYLLNWSIQFAFSPRKLAGNGEGRRHGCVPRESIAPPPRPPI